MDYEATLTEAHAKIEACTDARALKEVERHYLGRKGTIAGLLGSIGELPAEERKSVGQGANRLKQAIQQRLEAHASRLESKSLQAERDADDFDPSLPPARLETGSLHPITQVTRELEDLFLSMGYSILDGPEIELDYYNFEALNIHKDHPARDSHDTFFCDAEGRLVLRTHTSPVQIRAMEGLEPPFRIIAAGRCFRQETTDASHDHTFYQMEGMVVDREISVGHGGPRPGAAHF